MEMIDFEPQQLETILLHVPYVKIYHEKKGVWSIKQVFLSYEHQMEVIVESDEQMLFVEGQKVVCKCQHDGFEYVMAGRMGNICTYKPTTVSIAFYKVQRFRNLRKYPRYETDLVGMIKNDDENKVECTVRNMSMGGAAFITTVPINNEQMILHIPDIYEEDICLSGVIVRTVVDQNGVYQYGMKFEQLDEKSQMQVEQFIGKLQEAFEHRYPFSKYTKSDQGMKVCTIDTKILLVSEDREVQRTVKKTLLGLGAGNIEIIPRLPFLIDFFEKEQPKIVLLDLPSREEQQKMIEKISAIFSDTTIFAVDYFEEENLQRWKSYGHVHVLYKPFIHSELEQSIAQYL
jgi:c-di-GMP-binding flagellar brake protein YcgR/CheY-like chemotaxis protein